jgi:NADPH-dependent glutamate synthase beta subunit-like oxidoreductase/NAD(P)H-flavin reductase
MQVHIPGYTFQDLFDPRRLAGLTELFKKQINEKDPELHRRYSEYIAGHTPENVALSALLIEIAPHVGSFLARVFGVEQEYAAIKLKASRDAVIFTVKKEFFIRRVLKKYGAPGPAQDDLPALERETGRIMEALPGIPRTGDELEIASAVQLLLGHERYIKGDLPDATREFLTGLAHVLDVNSGRGPGNRDEDLKSFLTSLLTSFERLFALLYYSAPQTTGRWALFQVPGPFDFQHLVESDLSGDPVPGSHRGIASHLRCRDGFDLTDNRYGLREVESEIDYCIFCHERDKDSCSKGFHTDQGYRKNPLGFELKGCPLDQKISESQFLMNSGDALGALAVIMLDNPMVPGTGHRICNDCMKACIYQKQDPVNIPQIETRILTEVLDLPYGFEIYSLLTRWNPLNASRPHALPYNGMNILVVGLGPAGYTLAHYFLNEGFGVVAVDGLKIEPLPEHLVGNDTGEFTPVRDFAEVKTPLSKRVLAGFGGVSEYGITVRWDKNFLTVLQLNLMRRRYFRVYDGVRFGGTMSLDDAWGYGFEHVCFATGAGKPTLVRVKNNLVRGVRMASDFLMALQLTGAGKRDSMANLQVRLPAVVIGGGLTAIDTATEMMSYYPVQVSKIRRRYDLLVARYGQSHVDAMFDAEERTILDEFLLHAQAVETERKRAAEAGETPNFIPLVRSWGGACIYYRKSMLDSPAYRLNHEEIIKSLEEGIAFVECMNPVEAVPDEHGAVREMIFERMQKSGGKWTPMGELFRVPARTVIVAAGTVPNVMYEREHPGTFDLDDNDEFFSTYSIDDDLSGRHLVPVVGGEEAFFTSYAHNGRYVTYYGDNHPAFAGNVVKAMASAKQGYRAVLQLLEEELRAARMAGSDDRRWNELTGRLDDDLRARVVAVHRLTPTITEVVVRAPGAAGNFRPGQFYRLQNYEVDSLRVEDTLVMMEGIALTGAWVDRREGTVGLITLEVGASSRMCALLRPGQRVVVMGPTGSPTEITEDGTVLLLGGGLGNAVLFSIAKAFKEKNNRVIYCAGYKRKEDFFKREEIEANTDIVIYSVDAGEPIETRRPQDRSCVGTIIQAMVRYAEGGLGPVSVPLHDASRIIAIGSDRMMAAVARARHDVLRPYLNENHVAIASINSLMQCMMKAVCAQCLQRHVDPATGRDEFVFTCANQDQLMDEVDFAHLSRRLRANSVMEKIANRWLDYILETHPIPRI